VRAFASVREQLAAQATALAESREREQLSQAQLQAGEGEHAPFPFGLLPEGEHEAPKPPAGHWICMACTMFNPLSLFYCDVCNTARPDLGSVRF
jgi:hypothetical protein